MAKWLMKTEPETFSFADLLSRHERTEPWNGVRNYQARNFMRDQFRLGDEVFIYHSSTAEPAVMGVAEVVREAYPDPTALDPKSPYYDEKSHESGASRWVMVDVRAKARFATPVTLKAMREEKTLAGMALLKPGQRLSIQPVTEAEWKRIVTMGQPQTIDT